MKTDPRLGKIAPNKKVKSHPPQSPPYKVVNTSERFELRDGKYVSVGKEVSESWRSKEGKDIYQRDD